MPRERRAPAKFADSDVYDKPQHSASSGSRPAGQRLKLTLKRKERAAADAAPASKRLTLRISTGSRPAIDAAVLVNDHVLDDPAASSARLPSRAAAAARREHLEGKRTTKLTFKKNAEGSKGAAATRLTLKLPKSSATPPRRQKRRASVKATASAPAPTPPAAAPKAPLSTVERMRAVWRAVMDTTDRNGRRCAEIFERLPSPDELPAYYEFIAEPMDLNNIDAKLALGDKADGYGDKWPAFAADMLRVFNNARLFNDEGTVIFEDANRLEIVFHNEMGAQQEAAAAAVAASTAVSLAPATTGDVAESCDICCDTCGTWYTTTQVGLTVAEAESLKDWHCPSCVRSVASDFGPVTSAAPPPVVPFCDLCCDTCNTWYTTLDAGISVEEAEALDQWHCGICLGTHEPPAGTASDASVTLPRVKRTKTAVQAQAASQNDVYSSAAAAAYAAEVADAARKSEAEVTYYTGPALPDLPDDLLTTILRDLGTKDMLSVTMVSVSWHSIARRDSVWRSICLTRLRNFHVPRRARRSFMRLFLEQMVLRERRIEESSQRMFLKCDAIFRARTDNFSKLRKVLVDHKVGEGPDDEISVNRRGGTTWEDNPLVNLAAREGRARCVKELVENWGASIEIKDVGGFTPILEAAYHGHELLLRYFLARGADIDVQGVSLGTQTGNARSQNGPFSPLEWATRQGHRRCAEILAHASSAPARADAKLRREVEKCVNGMVDTIAREERQHEREQHREQKEVADVVRGIIQEIERGAREELRRHNDARRKKRKEEQNARAVEQCLDDVIKRIVKENDRIQREKQKLLYEEEKSERAIVRRALQERAAERRARHDVELCIEGIICEVEGEEVAAERGAAQCIERLVRKLERQEKTARLRACRLCLRDIVRRVVLQVDPDQAVPIRTYLNQRGLSAWASHLIVYLNVGTSLQARQVTAADLRRLGTEHLSAPIDEETIASVLEHLSMKIDPEVAASVGATPSAWTRTQNAEAKKRRQAQENAEKKAAAMRLTQNLIQTLDTSGSGMGYVAVHEIDASKFKLDLRDLELTGLSELASEDWRAAAADGVAAPKESPATPAETVQVQQEDAASVAPDCGTAAAKSPARSQSTSRVPAIVTKLRKFCEKSPCNGQLRVVNGTGAQGSPGADGVAKRPPYAAATLQIEPPPTTGRPDGVFYVGDIAKVDGKAPGCPQLAAGMGTVRVLRRLPAEDGRLLVQRIKDDSGAMLPVPPSVLRLKPDKLALRQIREAKAAAATAAMATALQQHYQEHKPQPQQEEAQTSTAGAALAPMELSPSQSQGVATSVVGSNALDELGRGVAAAEQSSAPSAQMLPSLEEDGML